MERVSGHLPRELAQTWNSQQIHQQKPFVRHSALSAAYASQGWLPAVRFIPCEAYAADKAWIGDDRLGSASQCDSRLAVSVNLSLSKLMLPPWQ